MEPFATLGSFFGKHLLLTFIWIVAFNIVAFTLCGEDENRVAHGKTRYPFVLMLIFAVLGGSLGAFIGWVKFHKKGEQFWRSVLYGVLILVHLALSVLCIVFAKENPAVYFKGMWNDAVMAFSWQNTVFGKALTFIWIFMVVMDVIAFAMFGIDKLLAKGKQSRIPEIWLIISALLGGAAGALIGMLVFRHKVRHAKFYVTIPALLLLQILFVLAVAFG